MKNNRYVSILNRDIIDFFFRALCISLNSFTMFVMLLKILFWQSLAIQTRRKFKKQNIHVPPFAIISVTNKCNLHCQGCYARHQKRPHQEQLPAELLKSILQQSEELGINIVLIVGGEPLIHQDLLPVISLFPKMIFPVFTNGLFINDEVCAVFKKYRHIIPVISIEGDRNYTDQRRGNGTFACLEKSMQDLKRENVFYGLSATINRKNFHVLIKDEYIEYHYSLGCRLFFFIDYVPFEEKTENMTLTEKQQEELQNKIDFWNRKYPVLFVSFPGGEEKYGGCLSAGRGFLHISASGDIEPCPFSPHSDRNIKNYDLKESLNSPLLEAIRLNETMLKESKGGCALWENRAWVKSILEKNK